MQRFLLLAGLVYLLLLAGLVLVDGRVLALALPLVVYLAAALVFAPGEAKLNVSCGSRSRTRAPLWNRSWWKTSVPSASGLSTVSRRY